MPEPVFVIRNQHGLYLTRQNEWVDGYDASPLFKAAFRDIALNTLIELNAKDIELRGTLVEVEVNEKGWPRVVPAEQPEATTPDGMAMPQSMDMVDALSAQALSSTDEISDDAENANEGNADDDNADEKNDEAVLSGDADDASPALSDD